MSIPIQRTKYSCSNNHQACAVQPNNKDVRIFPPQKIMFSPCRRLVAVITKTEFEETSDVLDERRPL